MTSRLDALLRHHPCSPDCPCEELAEEQAAYDWPSEFEAAVLDSMRENREARWAC